jgi:hypothetical protein
MFWATIIIGVPIAIFTFIKENFGAFAILIAVIVGFIIVCKGLNKVDQKYPSFFPLLASGFMLVIGTGLGVVALFAPVKGTVPGSLEEWTWKLLISVFMFATGGGFGWPIIWPIIKLVAARRKASLTQSLREADGAAASPAPEPQAPDPIRSPLRTP